MDEHVESAAEVTESEYYRFREFDRDNSRRVLAHYVDYFTSGPQSAPRRAPVLELACGPGTFLDLLREAGVDARGVDIDDGMVSLCRDAGHEVVLDDAVAHLRQVPDASLGGLFAAHFIEHLDAETAQEVYIEAARVLRPDGAFVAVVPNPACHSILAYDFWRDPTHVRPYDPMALSFFAERAGLITIESGGNPKNHPGPPPWLRHDHYTADARLSSNVETLVQHAQHEFGLLDSNARKGDPAAMTTAKFVGELGHLISILDGQIDALQRANQLLLDQLYPPNEVYVVAAKPGAQPITETDTPTGTEESTRGSQA